MITGQLSPTEKTTRYAATVEDMTAAWRFVMDKLDHVGPDPVVEIKPMWFYSNSGPGSIDDDEAEGTRHFEVVVSGMIEEDKDDG